MFWFEVMKILNVCWIEDIENIIFVEISENKNNFFVIMVMLDLKIKILN